MTHVPFTSRLASLIGLPSNPSPKYDQRQDDSYIPYTGTYASPPASTSQHTHTHAHTLSGSTAHNPPSSTYSMTSNPHPYNPERFVFLPPTASSAQTTMVEEEQRGRKRKSRPISVGSSFVSPSPLTEYHSQSKSANPSNPMVNVRRGGPSFIALDGGFIGQSPAPPPKDRWDIQREKEKQREREKGTYRTSLASFMTFGSSKRPSVSISISDPETTGGQRSLMGGPRSAQETYFPHGASKLRGEIPVGFGRIRDDGERGERGGERERSATAGEEDLMAPPAPAFLRQRSQSYVDETEATQQRKREEDRRTLSTRERRRGPTSFFDTSTLDEEERDPFKSTPILPSGSSYKPPSRTLNLNPLPHPYHRHKRQSIEHHPHHHQQLQHESAVDLSSPTSASFDFLHPYATATASTSNSSPSKSILSRNSNAAIRPLLIPRKSVPDPAFGISDRYPGPDRHRTYVRERESEDRHPHSAFPFINPFSSAPSHQPSPPVSRPVTPKGRLKSLAESGFKTIKGSISTPNLRQISAAVAEPRQEGSLRPPGNQPNTRAGVTRTGSSFLVPPHAVLQGQTICDTFFFPRPRLQAHTISPPDSPFVAVSGRIQQQQVRSLPTTTEAKREWDRRDTVAVVEGVDALTNRRDRGKEVVVGKKVSAPDLRRPAKEKERLPRTSGRSTMTEAEKALRETEEREREREEWSAQAKRSFQNKRSRSFSRSRTKSIAKASNAAASGGASAAASGDESDGKAVKERKRKHSGATSTASHAPLPVPPATTTTVGALTIRDEPREKRPDLERSLTFKSSMEYLAARAFSQGHQPAISISGTSGTHSRHHSADHTREKEGLGHRRSESWGKTLKKAKNACIDPESVSPAVDKVLPPFGQPASKSSHEISVLDIRPPTADAHTKEGSEETGTSAAVGIAIGTPPLDALLTTHAVHIEHPYGSPMASPSLPAFVMSDVVSRHRLPPRAHPTTTISPPRSPEVVSKPAIPDLDAYVPTIESRNQPMLSRESWLVYMNELEDNVEHDREVERPGVLHEEEEPRSSADLAEDTPDLQADLGSEASPVKNTQPQESPDSENQLTKAFRRRSAASMSGSSENEHAALVFEGGATLTRLLSSRSVTATPRMRARDLQEGGRSIVSLIDLDDPNATLTRSSSTRAPLPIFDPSQIPIPNTASTDNAGFRTSAHSEVLSSSGHDNSWRKSIVSSEAAHSQDSSPKASPRAFVNLDDLEGYSDLFYRGGGSTSGGRPKSGGSHKTTTSGDRGRRPELLQFGPKGSSALEVVERTFSPERTSSGSYYGSGVFSPPLRQSRALDEAGEGSWRGSGPRQQGEVAFDRTWDPEEDDDDAYRLVNPNLSHMPVPVVPIHRHSTKLSVIEGSVDEHATASESTPDPAEQESVPPTSPTQPDMVHPQPPSLRALPSNPTPIKLESLIIPSTSRPRTSSELAVGADPHARISMMTNTSGQSRISNLSDFPAPPTLEQNAFVLTPSNILNNPFPPRPSSPVPPPTPASVLSVEPPTPSAEVHEGEDRSVSEHYHQGLYMTEIPSPREYRSNRATFGPESEIASQWTDRHFAATPTTEES